MKTSVEIPDQLAREAKAHARAHRTTSCELIERGLRSAGERRRYRWAPVTTGRRGDPLPTRLAHELAYDGVLSYADRDGHHRT